MRLKLLLVGCLMFLPAVLVTRAGAKPTATPRVIVYPTVTARPRTATLRPTLPLPASSPLPSQTAAPTASATVTPTATAATVAATEPVLLLSVVEPSGTPGIFPASATVTLLPLPTEAPAGTALSTPEALVQSQRTATGSPTDSARSAASATVTLLPLTAEAPAGTGLLTPEWSASSQRTPAEPTATATESPAPTATAARLSVGVFVYEDSNADRRCDTGEVGVFGEPVVFQAADQTVQVTTGADGQALAGDFPAGAPVDVRYAGRYPLTGPAAIRLTAGDEPPCAFGLAAIDPPTRSAGLPVSPALLVAGVAAVCAILGVALIVAFRQSH